MKEEAPLNVRSRLTRGARLAGGLCFLVLAVVAIVAGIEPAWAQWSVFLVSLSGLLVIMFGRVAPTDPGTGKENEALVELARNAIRSEASRLDAKRQDLEKILMTYGEWMEFPDFKALQTIDWKDEAHLRMDSRVAELIDHVIALADGIHRAAAIGIHRVEGFDGKLHADG